MVQLCIPEERVPMVPPEKPKKEEIKYEYIIAGIVIFSLLAYILKPKR